MIIQSNGTMLKKSTFKNGKDLQECINIQKTISKIDVDDETESDVISSSDWSGLDGDNQDEDDSSS